MTVPALQGKAQDYGILIVGHGSREPQANQEFVSFVQAFRRHRPDLEIRLAYNELAQPDTKKVLLEFALTRNQILIVPLFLFTSGHIKNDIPLILAELKPLFPKHRFVSTLTLGIHPKLIELLFQRVKEAQRGGLGLHQPGLESPGEGRSGRGLYPAPLSGRVPPRPEGRGLPRLDEGPSQSKTGVILINRGSSDPDATSDFYKAVRLFEEGNRYSFVLPSFIGISRPLLSESLEMAAKLRPEKLLVIPYFLFGGKLIQKIEKIVEEFSQNYPWIHTTVTPYLGPDPALFEILDERIESAISGTATLPCNTCEYRQQLPGLPNKVGGLRALLWSLRHLETHNQAAPHEFPHKNLKKHVLICQNVDCASRGSIPLASRIRSLVKSKGKRDEIQITKTSCMGRCGEGPAVVIYPDGIWYQKVQLEDAEDLVSEHLLNDRIVSRLVDNIMQ